MKKIIFSLLLVAASATYSQAQSAVISDQNQAAIKNYDGINGSVSYVISPTERMNINYSLSPKNPSTEARFTLSTADATYFAAIVRNESGKVVLKWKAEQIRDAYILNWDLSKFKAGNYTIDIYTADNDSKSVKQLTFTKL